MNRSATIRDAALGALFKALGLVGLLFWENLAVILWPDARALDARALCVLAAGSLFLSADFLIRDSLVLGQRDRFPTRALFLYFGASPLLFGLPWAERIHLAPRWTPAWLDVAFFVAGMAALASGAALVLASRIVMDGMASAKIIIREDHRLVTRGPYRWMRHPIYAGDILFFCGFALAMGAPLSAVPILAYLLPMMRARMRLEERLLEERFGEDYRAWARRTPRLIPRLGRRARPGGT